MPSRQRVQTDPSQIVRMEIALLQVEPRIWRKLEVRCQVTFEDLCHVFNVAMGWHGEHMHELEIDGVRYGDPEVDPELVPERVPRLCEVAKRGKRFTYRYDFGDGWQHEVRVISIVSAEPGSFYPRVTSGARACPPEDCGGPAGYEALLAVLSDPAHPDYQDAAGWLGFDLEPDTFDLEETNEALRLSFRGLRSVRPA